MTRRRMPKRDRHGKFLPSAQRDERPPRPAGQDIERTAQRGVLRMEVAVICEECGDEIEYNWMHVGRRSYHVGRCMRCVPEPPIIE